MKSHWAVLACLAVALVFTIPLALLVGPTQLSPPALLAILRGDAGPALATVLWQLRVPRVLLGLGVGASLGTSGAALQEWLQNPLVEPGIGGVSSGAALGAVVALYAGLTSAGGMLLPICATVGSLVSVLLVTWMAGQEAGTQRVLLAGLVLTTGCNAGVALVLNLSPNPMASLELTFWLLGSLSDRSFLHLSWVAAPMVVGLALMLGSGRALRAWSLGPEAARSLGVRSTWLRWRILLGSALAVGAAVSVTGTIGFVGLFVPHLIRPRVGADAAWLLPTSALAGSILLIWADAAVRASAPLLQGIELKIGVTTALLGTPGLFWYALRARREAWA